MIAQEDLSRVHDAALRLLSDVGCAVLDPEAPALLAAHGAVVDGRRARIPERLVTRVVDSAPAGYVVAGRRQELDIRVGPDAPTVLGARPDRPWCSTAPRSVTARWPTCGRRSRSPTSHPTSPSTAAAWNLPTCPRTSARLSAHAHVTGSDKATRHTVADLAELQVAVDVAEILHGAS